MAAESPVSVAPQAQAAGAAQAYLAPLGAAALELSVTPGSLDLLSPSEEH